MSLKSSITHPVSRAYEFKGSLVRNNLFFILLISLIPLILFGTSTYIRTQQIMLQNTEAQMNDFLDSKTAHFSSINASGNQIITQLAESEDFVGILTQYTSNPNSEQINEQLENYLSESIVEFSEGEAISLTDVSIASREGLILASSNQNLSNIDVSGNLELQQILDFNEQHSSTLYNPSPMYVSNLVFLYTMPIAEFDDLILIGSYIEANPTLSIEMSNSFYPNAHAYYLINDEMLIGVEDMTAGTLKQLDFSPEHQNILSSAMQDMDSAGFVTYSSFDEQEVLGGTTVLGNTGLAILLEIPQNEVYSEVPVFGTINLLLLVPALVLSGFLFYLLSSRIIRPLIRLSEHARDFALGDWNQRVVVDRDDEIGLLANSFNQMVEQITDLYYSLEQKVENRTEQLGVASEVMQVVTSSTKRDELLKDAAELIAERFHYTYVSLYIVDAQGANAVLQHETGRSSDYFAPIRPRIRLGTESIVSKAIVDSHVEINNLSEETPDNPLPQSARNESAIPIAFANQVLGALYVQSPKHEPFDEEILPILQTISNQIASGIQSTLLIESAQINLEETTLLYRASRQITQVQYVDELTDIIQETMQQTAYLSGIFFTEEGHLSTYFLHDPAEPWRTAQFSDLINIDQVVDQLSSSQMLLFDDLSARSEFDSLLSYFIQYNCTSAVVFPIQASNKLTMVVVIGSREPTPMTETSLQPYANLFEVVTSSMERLAVQSTLEVRAKQLQTTAEIARDTSASLNLDELLQYSINLIRDRFGFYHASVFLMDPFNEYAELKESTGEAGKLLKEAKHRLAVGSQSVVGQATAQNKPQIINDVTATEDYFPNPQLPDTRSELAIPLSIGDQILGAIDVQSYEFDAFSADDVQILQILADQLATAVLNANLFEQTTTNLSQYQLLQEITTKVSASGSPEEAIYTTVSELRKALPQFQIAVFTPLSSTVLEMEASAGLSDEDERNFSSVQIGEGIIGEAAQKKEIVYKENIPETDKIVGYESEFAAPIMYQNRFLGVIYTKTNNPTTIQENYRDFFQALISSLGSIISNSDLIQRIRIQIERQKQIYDVTTKIRRSVDFETILQTSASEIGKHLGATRTKIIIHPDIKELTTSIADNGNQPSSNREVLS
ncbi:MAG: GAF domain-containing protein [Anaerolineaceae bacterium]|nr:GAF domain-containing protein [Anaerolineaceae bacterium]